MNIKIIYSILTILVPNFAAVVPARANTYYISSISGDDSRSLDQAQRPGTPWRTLARLNQIFPQLRPGDSVLLKRGETYYGSIVAGASGEEGKPIVLGAYGRGDEPVISGFSRLSAWRPGSTNGVWQASCPGCGVRVNTVVAGDVPLPMGRYPNSGYLTIRQHSGNNSITDNSLAGGNDWTGADLVIRKNRFILDRSTILSQQGGTLTYKGGSFYQPTDNFGYFIQNDIRTLDRPGEWYYDPKAHTMNMYYGAGPVPPDVMASSVDTLVTVKGRQHLVFSGLTFTGSNGDAFFISDAGDIRVSACRILFSSLDGVDVTKSTGIVLDHLSIDHSDDDGIDLFASGSTVSDCIIRHSGNIPGMGNPERSYIGINVSGANNTIQFNTVDTTGYVGIFFLIGPNTIRNNKVDYFCFVKDDGGGIYTWSGDIDSATRRTAGVVTGNIVLNGITAADGTDNRQAGIANGIYLDENTGQIEVSDNTVAHCTAGIFIQDSHEVTVKGNTLYDNGAQISVRHALAKGTLRDNDISDNTAMAARKDQTVLLLSSGVSGEVNSFTRMHDNHYASGGGGSFYKTVVRQNDRSVQDKGELGDWQSKYGKDEHSATLAPAGGVRFEYNATRTVKSVPLDGTYKDPAGKVFRGELKLEPYHSEILIPQ